MKVYRGLEYGIWSRVPKHKSATAAYQHNLRRYNKAELRIFLDSMKSVGFTFGAKAGLTVAMNDVKTPPSKNQILEKYL